MNTSEQVNELAAALAKAQGDIEGALKDSANPFFKSKYADLHSVWAACRKQLSANGISIIQSPEESENGIAVETLMMHSSGQWARSRYTMPVSKLDAQAVGSAITYARRYALSAMVGIAPEEDDGNAAAKTAGDKQKPRDEKPKTERGNVLPICTDEKFNENSAAWKELVISEKRTADDLIAVIKSKTTLTDTQIKEIKSWGVKQNEAA